MNEKKRPVIIFDTDMDTDVDDAGALTILLNAVKAGRIELAGIVVDVPDSCAAAACEVLCMRAGMEVPIGTIYMSEFPQNETDRYVRYRHHRTTLPANIYYNRTAAKMLGKCDRDYPHATEVYRRLLSGAEDQSVIITAVGFLTAIEQLWQSGPDEISPLDGYELFREKVKCVVSMGDAAYPLCLSSNFNYNMDRVGAKAFFDRCPCPVCISPDGIRVITGGTFSASLPEGDPLRLFYEIYNEGPFRGRMSWDLIAVLYAIDPKNPLFEKETHGKVCYDDRENRTYWDEYSDLRQDWLIHTTVPPEETAKILEGLMISGF